MPCVPGPRRLPTFVIVGAAKSGTTSLASYLRMHPDVYVVPEKELRFFDVAWDNGLDWYCGFFADAGAAKAVGEATPNYMADPVAVERLATTLPEAQLVVTLRNPVDRLYSNYWHQRMRSSERRPLREAVTAVPLYSEGSDYLPQLQRLATHYPRERLHVLLFEDLRDRPRETMAEVFRFLGVDPAFVPANLGKVYNPAATVRAPGFRRKMIGARAFRRWPRLARAVDDLNRKKVAYPPISPADRAWLLERFARSNDDLAAWLGRDLDAWKV